MAQWQAPATNNERHPTDEPVGTQPKARPYLDAGDGFIHWWSGADALPVGATPLYVVDVGGGTRAFSTDDAGETSTLLFAGSNIVIR